MYGAGFRPYVLRKQLGEVGDLMRKTIGQLGAVGGGLLLVVGSLMTWISVDLGFAAFSSTGTETTEGKLTLAAGVVLILLALAQLRPVIARRVLAYVAAAAAGFGAVVLFLEYLDVLDRISEADGTTATAAVGLGVLVAGVGALIALIATVWSVLGESPSRQA